MRSLVTVLMLAVSALMVACVPSSGGGTGTARPSVATYGAAAFVRDARAAGVAISEAPTATADLLPNGRAYTVSGDALGVYGFATDAAASAAARGVDPGGTTVRVGNQVKDVMFVAPPSWYRRGSVIVLYVGSDAGTLASLDAILGTPFAGPRAAR